MINRGVVVALVVIVGCTTNNTTTGTVTPTANSVVPAEGFTGRTLRVQVSGDATSWTAGATVDFGAGITVTNVAVASPTDLFADLAIDPGATVGMHDVTVTSNGTFTLAKAFEVEAPIAINATIAPIAPIAQGSWSLLRLHNLDTTHPFDPTPGELVGAFANLAVTTSAAGTAIEIRSVSCDRKSPSLLTVRAA